MVDSGVLNPDLLKSQKGGRLWAHARLRDRIDATIAHELAESESLDHKQALKDAARTKLPISPGARAIVRRWRNEKEKGRITGHVLIDGQLIE